MGQELEHYQIHNAPRREAQKGFRLRRERMWVDLACLKMRERVSLKIRVKLGCPPRYTQMVLKWWPTGWN